MEARNKLVKDKSIKKSFMNFIYKLYYDNTHP